MNCTYASYNADIAFSELLEGWPVLVAADSETSGHAWIIESKESTR